MVSIATINNTDNQCPVKQTYFDQHIFNEHYSNISLMNMDISLQTYLLLINFQKEFKSVNFLLQTDFKV